MWSASASESSGVIGPTSRRMRPRLSSRCVRSSGQVGKKPGQRDHVHPAILCGCARCGAIESHLFHVVTGLRASRWAAELLRPRAPALRRRAAARARSCVGVVATRATGDGERLSKLLDEALDRELPISRLAPLVLGDGAQRRPDPCEARASLNVGQRGRSLRCRARPPPASTTSARAVRPARSTSRPGARSPKRAGRRSV